MSTDFREFLVGTGFCTDKNHEGQKPNRQGVNRGGRTREGAFTDQARLRRRERQSGASTGSSVSSPAGTVWAILVYRRVTPYHRPDGEM